MTLPKTILKTLSALMLSVVITGCSVFEDEAPQARVQEDVTSAIGINGYLWRASLDTLSPFPISQVDSSGGVILTDWFINPDAPTERLKLSVYITDMVLRADALHVSIVRQELQEGVWIGAQVRAGTSLQIEDAILSRAREIKISTIDEE